MYFADGAPLRQKSYAELSPKHNCPPGSEITNLVSCLGSLISTIVFG